jgi:hypothetical protein
LAVNKIFVSKTELKHTSSKVVITLYVYNEERRILIRKIKRLEAILFPFPIFTRDKLSYNVLQSQVNSKNKLLSLKEKLDIFENQEDNISFIN